MSILQSRLVNAHYFVVERFVESFDEEDPPTFLRTIRVQRTDAPEFFERLLKAVRSMFGLADDPAVSNTTANYTDLIRQGVLRNINNTVSASDPFAPGGNDFVAGLTPVLVPPPTRAFVHFESSAPGVTPSYVDIFFYRDIETKKAFTAYFGVYLNHSIIAGPLGPNPFVPTPDLPNPVEPPPGG